MLWGLPISLGSPFGNMFFTPILIIFLFLSSLIFFFELLSIPNYLLIILLDKITIVWNYLLSFGSGKWMVTFPLKSYLPLILLPLITIIGLQHKKLNNIKSHIVFFSVILLIFGIYFKISSSQTDRIENVELAGKKLEIQIFDNKIYLKDVNAFSRTKNPESWIEYTFIPYLIRNYGHANIECLEVDNLNDRKMNAIKHLTNRTNLKMITVNDQNLTYLKEALFN